ncbi:MAG: sialate O-acetylesterase, partial [Bacteroidaceae bacterium]|nr:sialate O-acetylesterase [Bacteroidaceae bacterium]
MGDLPFYYVEICPYDWWWAKPPLAACAMREQQLLAQSMLPNMGMVCTNDLVKDYEHWQIHPCMKREVGERLCFWALSETYGMEGISCKSPTFQSMEIKDGKAIITFNDAEEGFNRNYSVEGFEICGPDSVFYTAHAGPSGNRVTVQAAQVKEPVAVRYCYKPFQVGNLKNNYGLPVVPFRTDHFPLK